MADTQFLIPPDAISNGDNTYTLADGSVIDDQGDVLQSAPGASQGTSPCGCQKRARYNMMHGMVNNHLLSLVFLVLIIMGAVWIAKKI